MFLMLVLVYTFLASAGQIAMKNGMNQVGEIASMGQLFQLGTLFHIFTSPYVLIGLSLYAIAQVPWLAALSRFDVSLMHPLASLAYVVTAIVAFVFLKEDITLWRWAGIFLVMGGLFLIAR
ncbi:EamA family transporter [Chloroflexota bacterium]